ncbi:MAG TPA: glycine zipper domain-containing protein [Candidatus Binatia bacterium]|jgi:phage tail tape-measure protein
MNARLCALLNVSKVALSLTLGATLLVGCAGGSLTTREKGAGIGALGGAAAGGIIGSAVRHPAAGAAIGAAIGLGAGALIGDQLQGRENEGYSQDQQVYENQLELERQRRELEELRRRREY